MWFNLHKPISMKNALGLGPIGAALQEMQDSFGVRPNAQTVPASGAGPKENAAVELRARWQEDAFDPAKAK